MEKFTVDGNNQRIIRVKSDMPENVPFNEAYVDYSIPFADLDDLIIALKVNGNIKPEIKEVPVTTAQNPTQTSIIFDNTQMQDIMNTQANMLDRQLSIIEMMLKK